MENFDENAAWEPAFFEVDLSSGVPDGFADELRFAFYKHHLVIVRTGKIGFDVQAELGAFIGPVLGPPDSMTFISNVREDGYFGTTELAFHNDLFFGPYPPLGASLHAIEVVDGGSSTRFANAARACRILPEPMKERLKELTAVHISGEANLSGRNHLADKPEGWPQMVRPVIWNHPKTGLETLAVNYEQTDQIVGMMPDESEAMLQELYSYIYQEGNVYEHVWKNGDLIYWDNLALQHARGELSSAGARTLQRVTFGGKPFAEQYPARAKASFDMMKKMTQEAAQAVN